MESSVSKTPNKILVLREAHALGANVIMLPSVVQLRKSFPLAHIAWYGHTAVGSLAPVDEVHGAIHPISPTSPVNFADYDIVLSGLQAVDVEQWQASLPATQLIRLFRRPDIGGDPLYSRYLMRTCAALDLTVPASPDFGLPARSDTRSGVALLLPSGNSPMKLWKTKEWCNLANQVEAPLIVCDPKSKAIAEEVKRACPMGELLYNPPIKDLVERLRHIQAYVGLETGLSHLAGAMGLPGVCLRPHYSQHWTNWAVPGANLLLVSASAADVMKVL